MFETKHIWRENNQSLQAWVLMKNCRTPHNWRDYLIFPLKCISTDFKELRYGKNQSRIFKGK